MLVVPAFAGENAGGALTVGTSSMHIRRWCAADSKWVEEAVRAAFSALSVT